MTTMSKDIVSLTNLESDRLAECEAVIERGQRSFIEVGAALLEILDARLYKETHSTFEDYCRDRWDFGRTYASRLIKASLVTEELLPIGNIPATETQARELVPLLETPETMRAVWTEVVDSGQQITAPLVKATVEKYKPPTKKKAPAPTATKPSPQYPIPAVATAEKILAKRPATDGRSALERFKTEKGRGPESVEEFFAAGILTPESKGPRKQRTFRQDFVETMGWRTPSMSPEIIRALAHDDEEYADWVSDLEADVEDLTKFVQALRRLCSKS